MDHARDDLPGRAPPGVPGPGDEAARLEALRAYGILDTPPEQSFDDLVRLAAQLCAAPTALMTLVDERRQWFKSRIAFPYPETHREFAFCAHAIETAEPMVVTDATQDPRFANNPLVVRDPYLRFYAGAPITTPEGHALGTIAVLDTRPRELEPEQVAGLQRLARQAAAQLELRRLALQQQALAHGHARERVRSESRYRVLFDNLPLPAWLYDRETLQFLMVNPAAIEHYGWSRKEFLGMGLRDIRPPEEMPRLDAFLASPPSGPQALGVWSHRRKDGSQIEVEIHSDDVDFAGRPARLVIAHDVTEQRRADARIRRQNRMLAVLSGVNALIVRVRDRESLFDGACRIAVDDGGLAAAWIGWIDESGRGLRPVACAGEAGFCDSLSSTPFPLDMAGRSATVAALRGREPIVVADSASASPLLEDALATRFDFRSMVVLPLLIDGTARGAMTLYSRSRGALASDEIGILTELTDDVAFALSHLETEERAHFFAHYDPLTGLANRALLLERLERELGEAARRGSGHGLAVLDIDRFRQVNESLGRGGADTVLTEIAERLRAAAGEGALVARLAADRFAVAGSALGNEAAARQLFEGDLLRVFTQPVRAQERELHLSAKAGIALFPRDADRADALLAKAEASLRDAKRQGAALVFHAPDISTRLSESLALESRLRSGLARGELSLHYQPRVRTGDGVLTGLEALMRWTPADGAPVGPDRFIPLMEETGLILEAGRWAMEQLAADCRRWAGSGPAAQQVALNISALQLRQPDFVDTVVRLAGRLRDSGTALELELTESVLMENVQSSIETLAAIRDAGIAIAVDDFGTGYSSLSYLARLPVDALKIDRGFVLSALDDDYCRTIVTTVISLAHTLGLKVIAEGVGNEQLAEFLARMQCDELQGFAIARPLPPGRVPPLLEPDWRGRPGEPTPEVP